MRGLAFVPAVIAGQRGFLLPWLPVLAGAGIGIYFGLRAEPSELAWTALAGLFGSLCLAATALPPALRPLALAAAAVCAGLLLAGLRAHLVAAPVLEFRYYGPVQGRIVAIDRSSSDALRLTLDRVVLERLDPGRTPARVRVSLHGQGAVVPEPGMVVMTTANLAPPEGPVEPGGYDFRRQAWFDGLGAVGYSRTPVLLWEPPPPGPALVFQRLRMAVSAEIRRDLPGQAGAFAAVLMTGDRSGLSLATTQALRDSNLSHLLSISGLHMVLVCGTVFAAVRLALALVPPLALRLPIRKIAAGAALLAGAFYYLLSGREVPAERAYVMVAVMFLALIADRRAISLRSVAIAALVVLALRPESLTEPGFQMSFAATVALVAAFAGLREAPRLPRWAAPAAAVLLSSVVAGAATAPYAAAHFNRLADYGLIANLLTVPLMGLWVMPAGILAALLMPFGLHGLALKLMEPPLVWTLAVAGRVAGLEGAVTPVVAPAAAVLPMISLGGLMLVLWQGRARLAGLAPVLAGFLLWSQADRPALLISSDGALMGLMTAEGRALSKPRGQGFAARSWLEDDGDRAGQEVAAGRAGFAGDAGERQARVAGLLVRQFSGRGAAERAAAACGGALVILAAEAQGPPPPDCAFLDARALALTGPLAIRPGPEGPLVQTTRSRTGERLWQRAGPPPPIPLPRAD